MRITRTYREDELIHIVLIDDVDVSDCINLKKDKTGEYICALCGRPCRGLTCGYKAQKTLAEKYNGLVNKHNRLLNAYRRLNAQYNSLVAQNRSLQKEGRKNG